MYDHVSTEWRFEPKPGAFTPLHGCESLVCHHIGDGVAPTSRSGIIEALRSVYRGHLASPEGYQDIAYNAAVDQNGECWELRGMQYMGGATYGANDRTKAVLWIGGSGSTPSDAACARIARLFRDSCSAGELGVGATITGHKDWVATGCPGNVYACLPRIRQLTADPKFDTQTNIQENDEMPTHLCNRNGSIFGCFQGIYRQLSGPELEVFGQVKTIKHSDAEWKTLTEWGRIA